MLHQSRVLGDIKRYEQKGIVYMWNVWCRLNNYFNDVNLEDIKFVDLNFDFESPNVFALFENI